MHYKKIHLLILLMLFISSVGFAQQKTISGTVYDANGNTLPGATVVVPGTTTGVTTDFEGRFTLEVARDQNEIEVSFIGYLTERVSIEGRETVDVVLYESIEQLQEVVVTALGIKRESKALGYSVQQVDAEELSNTSRINPLSGLVGQVAGLDISESGSGAGGSSRVTIRGANSMTMGNEPLFVIDGIPIDNSGGSSGGLFGGFDYGNAINNINLDDVESISVLKGGAASALYGSRGQNGVIMITTRSGSKKEGIGVGYQFVASTQSPLIKPDFQTSYAQGSSGSFLQRSSRNWGPKMNGQMITNFLGEEQNLMPVTGHRYDDFFSDATSFDHILTLDKRTENTGVLFSASWTQNQGMIPTNDIDRKSLNLRFDSKLADYILVDARANYIRQEAFNRPNLAGSPDNPVYLLYHMPASVSMDHLEEYQTLSGHAVVWTSLYDTDPVTGEIVNDGTPEFATSPLLQNPYWAANLNTNRDERNRLLGFASMNIDFAQMLDLEFDLDLNLKAGIDYFNDERQRIVAHNTYYKLQGLATGSFTRLEIAEANYDFLLSGGHQWGDFTLQSSFGGNIMQRRSRSLSSSSESGLINPVGPYVIQNFNNPIPTMGINDREVHSLYGLVSMDYRRMVFLDITYRNDWTSVLAAENRSYGYRSISASWLLEETFDLPNYIDMLKIRGSLGETGSGGDLASMRYVQFGTQTNQYFGLPYGFTNSIRPEFFLLPEFTVTNEVGIESIFFGNRLRTDVSYYQSGTRDQIFRNPLTPSSGFQAGFINSGFVLNTGVELFTSYKIIETNTFSWTSSANFTRQWSEVREISEDIDLIIQSSALGDGGVRIAAMPGHPAGVILGTAFARDSEGRLILNEQNLPTIRTDENEAILTDNILGNATPDILWGFNSSFKFRRFTASFHIDSKLGHEIFSV
ncbi:MAG: SusC/RagA family TonB-linked outer membrane protein, partial [Bacteroidota bacterium]